MPPGFGYSDPRLGLLRPGGGFGLLGPPKQLPDPTPIPAPPPLQVEPMVPQARGLRGALSRVFAGRYDPRLTPEENKRARDAALIQGGLSGLAASGRPGSKLTDVLAAMGLAGQEARMQQNQLGRADARTQEMKDIISQGEMGVQMLHQMFAQAVSAGDAESARSIATVINAVEAARRPRATSRRVVELINPETGKPARYLVDDEGNKTLLGESPGSSLRNRLQAPKPVINPETGEVEFRSFNPDSGSFTSVEGGVPIPAAGSEGERKAAAFSQFIPQAKEYIDNLTGAPGRVEQALQNRGIREFTDSEQQQLQLAGSAMAEAWLRMTTGAAYNEREFRTAYNLFVPQPGDRAETLEMKKQNRERLMEMLRTQSGRLGTPRDSSGLGPFDDLPEIP